MQHSRTSHIRQWTCIFRTEERCHLETNNTATENESHAHRIKLRSHRKRVLPLTCVNETSLETEFYKYVDEILTELNIDCYSFCK